MNTVRWIIATAPEIFLRDLRPFFSKVGTCHNPNFRAPGLAVAQVDLWTMDDMTTEKRALPSEVIVVGQSAGSHLVAARHQISG